MEFLVRRVTTTSTAYVIKAENEEQARLIAPESSETVETFTKLNVSVDPWIPVERTPTEQTVEDEPEKKIIVN